MAFYIIQLILVFGAHILLSPETDAQTRLPIIFAPALRLNVCGICSYRTNPYCCGGWTNGTNDGQSCLTPVCQIPCGQHGVCTSPNTCSCNPGYIGDHCNTESELQYDVNLLHGKLPNQGLLQVRVHDGEWKLVHPDNWSRNNSHVACQQLGYHFSIFYSEEPWPDSPEASSQFLQQRFSCVGNEDSLQDCDIFGEAEEPEDMQIVAIECYDSSQYGTITGLKNKCGSPCDQDTFSRIGCKCDPLCENYGDCCPDYFTNDNCESGQALQTQISAPELLQIEESCVSINDMTKRHMPRFSGSTNFDWGYFYINHCSNLWIWDDEISRLCTNDPNANDPITFIPVHERNVSNPPARKIYKNIFCSVCNFRDIQEIQAWNVTYSEQRDASLKIYRILPPFEETAPRTCILNVKSAETCLYYHMSISKMCKDLYIPWHVSSDTFSSVFCAVCSDIYPQFIEASRFVDRLKIPSIQPAKCGDIFVFPPGRRPNVVRPDVHLHSLFDFGNQANDCDETELYDFFSQTCRLLTCPSQFVLSNGTCEQIPIALALPGPGWEGHQTVQECAFDELNRELDTVNYLNGTITFHENNVTGNTEAVVIRVRSDFLMSSAISLNNILEFNKSKGAKVCNVSSFIVLSDDHSDEDRENSSCIHRDELPGCVLRNGLNQDFVSFTNKTALIYEFFWKKEVRCYGIRMVRIDCNSPYQSHTHCAEVEIALEEFDINISANNTTTILHKASGKVFSNDEFRFGENGTVRICASLLSDADMSSTLGDALSYLTFVCFVLSLVGTFMTFISYCVFKELRNVTGYTVMNLLGAFFVAQLTFLLSPYLLQPPGLCLTSAVVGHFTWLSGFFWMNALSFVTTNTLSRNTLVRDKTMEMCRLIRYMLYAWGSPLLIVGVCISIHFCDCTEIAPIYGQKGSTLCWLIGHSGYANLWGFIAPVFALLLCNVVLFIFAVVSFRLKSAKSKTTTKRMKVEISVYIKLTILMGLPWLLGFVLTFRNNIYLNYVYTVLNSLQGVFIFWALVLTGRAGKLWRHKIIGSRGSLRAIGRPFQTNTTSNAMTNSSFSMSSTREKGELQSNSFNSASNM